MSGMFEMCFGVVQKIQVKGEPTPASNFRAVKNTAHQTSTYAVS